MVPENQPTPSPAVKPEAEPLFQGGPGGQLEAPQAPAAAEPVTVTPPASVPRQVVIGNMVFNTEAEAIAYAHGLEQQRGMQQQISQTQTHAARPKPSDILFEDPDAAFRMLEESIDQKRDAREAQQRQTQQLWDGFYGRNADLKGQEDVVEFIKQKHWNEIKDLPTAQSLPFLAAQARSYISKVRGDALPSEQLPSKPAVVAGASGPTPPAAQVPQSKPTTFVDEIASLRRRKSS